MIQVLIALPALFLFSCSAPADIRETRFVMGTLVEFTIADADAERAAEAVAAAAAEMQRIEDAFTIYGDAENGVKALNGSPPGTTVRLSDEVSALLELSLHIKRQSRGLFDPALGRLNLLWGFSLPDAPTAPPSAQAIGQAMTPARCVEATEQGWQRLDERCQLDFGAIAKGYAIDRGVEILKEHGIGNAIINAGGDLRLLGRHSGRPWRIGIRHPRNGAEVIATLELEGDVSVVTSGDYERFFDYQGRRFHHIINPETGLPAATARSATVIAPNATLADAWSTALFILGADGIGIMNQMSYAALVVDNKGNIHMNRAMEAMLVRP